MRKAIKIISICLAVLLLLFLGIYVGTAIKMNHEVLPVKDTSPYEPSPYVVSNQGSFIPWNEQIETDSANLTGANWLSGVSGERRLNEINTMVSHDSAMADVASATISFGSFAHRHNDAVTQNYHIFGQLESGIRGLDLRLNNKCVWKNNRKSGVLKDDGENLYLCHGKNRNGGTFFAKDPDTGYPLNFTKVLQWTESFLAAHPTEYVVMLLSAECQNGADVPKVIQRLDKILRAHLNDINPATGESYFYLLDGEYGKEYTDWPKLKDVRGKIVIQTNSPTDYDIDEKYQKEIVSIGGILDTSFGGKYHVPTQNGTFKYTVQHRLEDINEFAGRELGARALPCDASPLIDETTGKSVFMKTCTNCTGGETNRLGIPAGHPYVLAEQINKKVFGAGNVFSTEKAGRFVGWVSGDGYTDVYCSQVWKTNIFDGLIYKTVTVRSNKEGVPDQTFRLLRGTEITIPGFIYVQQNDLSGSFQGWKIGDTSYSKGAKYTLLDDVTFDATWA